MHIEFLISKILLLVRMFGTKSSNLNPLANTFVPSNSLVSSEIAIRKKVSTQSLASKLIKDLLDNKKNKCDKAVTQEDFMVILEKLIPVHYELIPDDCKLMSYLTKKIPNRISIKVTGEERDKSYGKDSNKIKPFDLSLFNSPQASILLVTLWGLYRHEQAMRPMLSLTYRPEKLKDPIWSVTSQDLKIWNPSATESPCDCPPMFGYTIPLNFFGNPFNLTSSCSRKDLHLNHYPETTDGNEFIFLRNFQENKTPINAFAEFEEILNVEYNLEYYSEQMKGIVSSVCNLISAEDVECKCSTLLPSDIVSGSFIETLWDSDSSKSDKPMNDEVEEDDNCHPLLDACCQNDIDFDTEVSGIVHEVEEMLQRSLSTESATDNANLAEETEPTSTCDPPCSVWCNSHPISRSNSVSSDIISFLNETTEFLLNNETFASKEPLNKLKTGTVNAQKACFRRSFSVNDCDLYDERYKVDTIPQVSTSTREALSFLRKDPINFFKRLRNRSDSWKDNDSGIMSRGSSQEEIFSEGDSKGTGESCSEYEDPASMWGFFSGEGSLWKPLPSSAQPNESTRIPHKRVRDLRRQRSIN